jgi:HipA-like kinase
LGHLCASDSRPAPLPNWGSGIGPAQAECLEELNSGASVTIEAVTAESATAGELTARAVTFARLRPGAKLLTDRKGVNDTYFGTIYCDDYEGQAYVKDLPIVQLANELVAAVVGIASGLPIPRPFLVLVETGQLPSTHGPLLADETARLAFASQSSPFEQVGQMDRAITLAAVKKWPYLADAICFDELIANGDRHSGNVLFQAPDRFLIIDHSHAFTGPNWEPDKLLPEREVRNQLVTSWPGVGNLTNDERQAIAGNVPKIAARCRRLSVNQAVMASFVAHILDSDRQLALVDFLKAR